MKTLIEKNEFGIKRTTNRLCLLCKKYTLKRNWKKHIKECEKIFLKENLRDEKRKERNCNLPKVWCKGRKKIYLCD